MKNRYLKTGNKKVIGAVMVAASMMMGLTACGGNAEEEAAQAESSVVESSVEESSIEESSVEDSGSMEESSEESLEVMAETRTFTMDVDGVETEFVETLFASEDGFNIWYQAELLEIVQEDGTQCFVQVGVDEAVGASVRMLLMEEAADMEEMLLEAANSFSEDLYEEITVGEILTLENEAELEILSIQVDHDDTADRFYAVSDGEKVLMVTVNADAESMENLSAHFDRMASTIEFVAAEAEVIAE